MHYRFDPFIEPSRALSISYACWIFQEVSSTYLQQDRRPCRFVWIYPADLLSSIYYSSPAGKVIFNPFSNHMLFVKNHAITIKLSIWYRNFPWIIQRSYLKLSMTVFMLREWWCHLPRLRVTRPNKSHKSLIPIFNDSHSKSYVPFSDKTMGQKSNYYPKIAKYLFQKSLRSLLVYSSRLRGHTWVVSFCVYIEDLLFSLENPIVSEME